MGGYLRWSTPLARSNGGVPEVGYPPCWGTPPIWTWLGYPPPAVDRQMDRHVSKHNLPVVLRTRSVKIVTRLFGLLF